MAKGRERDHLMSLVLIILERVTMRGCIAEELSRLEIDLFIRRCVNEFCLSSVSSGQEELFQLVLKRCEQVAA